MSKHNPLLDAHHQARPSSTSSKEFCGVCYVRIEESPGGWIHAKTDHPLTAEWIAEHEDSWPYDHDPIRHVLLPPNREEKDNRVVNITVTMTPTLAGLLHEGSYKFSFVIMGQIEGGRFEFFKPYTRHEEVPDEAEEYLGGRIMWCKTVSDAVLLMAYEEAEGYETMLLTDNAWDPDEDDASYVVASKRPFPISYVADTAGTVHIYDDEWMTLCGAGPTKEWEERQEGFPLACEACHVARRKQCHA